MFCCNTIKFTQGNETLFPNWQKESWQTFEETSGYVRPERVNKWPNSMTDMMMMMKFITMCGHMNVKVCVTSQLLHVSAIRGPLSSNHF